MTTATERQKVGDAIRNGQLDLLYVSPERFSTDIFIERLKTIDIAFFAIDEAHCISEPPEVSLTSIKPQNFR